MTSHAIALLIQVSAANYADAARHLRDGNLSANPLALALIGLAAYVLAGCTAEQITLIDVATGRHYSGPVPADLAEYLERFRRGERIVDDRKFALALTSNDD
jgi:hypothetical protein